MVVFMAVTFLVVVVQDIPLGGYLERVERERIVTALERDAFLLAGRSEDTLEAGMSRRSARHGRRAPLPASQWGAGGHRRCRRRPPS